MTQQEHPISRVLVIAAHPDDIEFGAAGTVAKWVAAGVEVVYCMVTDGSAGSNDPDVNLADLITRRRDEQNAAAACVGVRDVRYLGYQDGALEPTMALRRDLTRAIRDVKPDVVMMTDPTVMLVQSGEFDYINHPDHRAAAEAALYAVFPSAETRPIFPELLAEGLEPFHVNELWMMLTDKPNTTVDISDFHEQKLDSLICHMSQLTRDDLKFVSMFDEIIGQKIGVKYAEEFRVMRFYPAPANPSEAAE